MKSRSSIFLAVLSLLLAPALAWAGGVVLTGKEVGTGQPGPTGTVTLAGGGKSYQVPQNQKTDIPDGTYWIKTMNPSYYTRGGRCSVLGDSNCEARYNPVYPYQIQAPPWSVITTSPFFESFQVDNLPARFGQTIDRTPGGTFFNRLDRRGLGQDNNFENYPFQMNMAGVELTAGLPQLNCGIFQFNSGLSGLIGGAEFTGQVTSRADNQESNRRVHATGPAGGLRLESVFSAPGAARPFNNMALRGVVQQTWYSGEGGVSRIDSGTLGAFGYSPRDSFDVNVSGRIFEAGGDFIYVLPGRHVDVYAGARYRQIAQDMWITGTGITGFGLTHREVRSGVRGDQYYFPVGAEVYMGDWIPMFAPLAGRVETQLGPDSFGVFVKVGWMWNTGGYPSLSKAIWRGVRSIGPE